MAIQNPIIRAQLTAFENSFGYHHDRESENFERYSIFSIANGREGLSSKPDDLHLPTDDFGIDGAGLIVAGEAVSGEEFLQSQRRLNDIQILLFQSKTTENLNYGDMAKFFDASISIFTNRSLVQSPELKSFCSLLDELFSNATKFSANPSLTLYYVVTGKAQLSDHISTLIKATEDRLASLSLFSHVGIICVGAEALQSYFRLSTDAATATFPFRDRIPLPDERGVKEAHIGFIAASDLISMTAVNPQDAVDEQRINSKLFFDNVRDYDPDSEINKSIGESITASPSAFVFRNNGITVVARDGRATGNSFYIEGLQIVNGCQTTNILFEHRKDLVGVFVPLRLIISDDAELVNDIIISTNRQNPVKEEQFWALRPFLKNFEEYLRNQPLPRTLFFERRENQFRFQDVPERVRIIDASTLLKSVVAMFLCLPNRAGRDFRQIKREYDDRLFLADHGVKPYHAAAYAYYRLEYMFRNHRLATNLKIYRMFIIWFVGYLCGGDLSQLSLAHNGADRVADGILTFLDDEQKFLAAASGFVNNFTAALKARNIQTERDALRSDTALAIAKEVAANIRGS